jgi:O-antigen/teichoic acid export membrane protein
MARTSPPTASTPSFADTEHRAGEHEKRLAVGTLAQQLTYIVSTITMLAVITTLGRTLSLSAFGTYGILVSVAAYLLVAQGTVEGAAVRAIANATEQEERDRAFSTAFLLYTALGLAVAAIIVGVGWVLVGVLRIPTNLHHQARLGLLALGAVTACGWPLKTFSDLLRGSQLFILGAFAEMAAWVVFGLAMGTLLVIGAPLWLLVGVGGSAPMLIGVVAGVVVVSRRLPFTLRRSAVSRASVREFGRVSSYLLMMSGADLVVYSLDRVILGLFRPASAVAQYEGPVRAHNVVRQIHGLLALTVLPAASRYLKEGDTGRVRDLLVRGTRYSLIAQLPFAIVFMVLAKPILVAWLGGRYAPGAAAMTILVGYWLVGANYNVASSILVAAGRLRALAIYSWSVALLNLGLSLALTPSLGLNGVVLGTTIAGFVLSPVMIWLIVSSFPISLGELARESWLPAYSLAAALAAVLIAVRLAFGVTGVGAVAAVSAGGLLAYWAAAYAFWLRPNERALVRQIAASGWQTIFRRGQAKG